MSRERHFVTWQRLPARLLARHPLGHQQFGFPKLADDLPRRTSPLTHIDLAPPVNYSAKLLA